MGIFKRWFNKMVRQAWEEARNEPEDASVPVAKLRGSGARLVSRDDIDSAPTINFSLSFAQGGKIITTSHYEPKTDRHNRTVHVIPDEDDFAERVKEIVFKECLTRG